MATVVYVNKKKLKASDQISQQIGKTIQKTQNAKH